MSRYHISGTMMLYRHRRDMLMAITASEARKRLFPLIRQVNDDRAPVEIISNHGRAYLVAADDYESMEETDYLLRSPANAARLMAAAEEVRSGRSLLTKSMTELEAMASEDEAH
jgi:antitoxin YefM